MTIRKRLVVAAIVALFSVTAFAQVKATVNVNVGGGSGGGSSNTGGSNVKSAQQTPPPPPPPAQRGNQIAAYVFGMEQAKLGEDLSQYIVDGLANSKKYSQPRRGARGFYQAADREQAKMRGRLLEDRNFCKIGTDYEIEFLVIIDIEKAGRGNSIFARILDLETCKIIATGENTSLIRNDQEARAVANDLVAQLLKRNIGKRGGGAPVASSAPAPAPRGNQIAAYVFGMEQAKLGEDLSQYIVDGLANSKKYSQPRKGARGFYAAADKVQARQRGKLLEDRDFCKVGTDYEIEYLVIIDIEKAGRGNSVYARILDLETCKIIATGENTSLIRNDQEARTVANDLVTQLLKRSINKRGGGVPINR